MAYFREQDLKGVVPVLPHGIVTPPGFIFILKFMSVVLKILDLVLLWLLGLVLYSLIVNLSDVFDESSAVMSLPPDEVEDFFQNPNVILL